ETVTLPIGNHLLHVPPPPPAGGLVEAQLVGALTEGRSYADAPASERRHLFAEASKRVFAAESHWLQPDGGAAGSPSTLLEPTRLDQLMADYEPGRAVAAADLNPPPSARPENPWATGFIAV